ncbi:MAG: multisubunit Na+/H+ antiporter MnhF subunit [Paracoccaceae bacterium]|jgi:multisubunit Na+/H+ antiporter MnhF subunit
MLNLATFILGLAVLLTLITPAVARTNADKVIVIDILSFQVLGLCILLAFHDRNPLPLQFGLLVAMLGFLSTIVLSRFIHRPKS